MVALGSPVVVVGGCAGDWLHAAIVMIMPAAATGTMTRARTEPGAARAIPSALCMRGSLPGWRWTHWILKLNLVMISMRLSSKLCIMD